MIDRLLHLTPEQRSRVLANLNPTERAHLNTLLTNTKTQTRWQTHLHDPAGFITTILGETLWSKQRDVLNALATSKRVAVPASHSVSKTHTAARCAAWWIAVHPPGTSMVITTAPTFRQVRNILWPHIRRLRERHDLPGETNLTEWKIDNDLVAWGFSAADNDEAAVQGVHAPNLLIIVDEAGGIGHTLGNAIESITTGSNTRLLLIGNPPTDEEKSWFELACADPEYKVIKIAAADSPNLTDEDPGECYACPTGTPTHPVAEHLVDREWVDQQIRRFGPDSNFVEARVRANFPQGTNDKTIPWSWIEAATTITPEPSTDIRLGVDVAADGGDEFVIALARGWEVSIIHKSSGPANASQVDVAGKIATVIRDTGATRVKIDSIGVGRGTTDLLQSWAKEGKIDAQIIGVNVAEKAQDTTFKNQRAEMWWNTRQLLSPDQARVRLNVDADTLAQLSGPKYRNDSGGRIQIESKADMKRRGIPSPDRAEAVLLALYEPPRAMVTPVVAFGASQANTWRI